MCEYDQSIPFAKLVPHLCYVIGKTNKKNPNAYVQLKSKKKTILSEKSLLFKRYIYTSREMITGL